MRRSLELPGARGRDSPPMVRELTPAGNARPHFLVRKLWMATSAGCLLLRGFGGARFTQDRKNGGFRSRI